jgi:hypothetical protein
MLSMPMGFEQHGAAGFVSRITSVSIGAPDWPLATVTKFPNVFPWGPDTL